MSLVATGKHSKNCLPQGQLLDVGGHRLHLHCSGPFSSSDNANQKPLPTVVIEAGCGWHSTLFYWLHEKLSQSLRVCSYDRAGLGWSEESRKPRDAEHIATQLHTLLDRAGIDGPILLVGHSIAGLYLRVYAGKYPENIVGMVLLDASHPKQYELLPNGGFTLRQRLYYQAMGVYASIGLSKIHSPLWELKNCQGIYLPEPVQQHLLHLLGFRQSYITPMMESDAFEASAKQALAAGDLGDMPLAVITAPASDIDLPAEIWKKHQDAWQSLQRDLLNLSSNSQHRIIEDAGHCTLITKKQYAEQVADIVFQLINQKNGSQAR